MGKATDLAIALIILIVGLWVLTRLGISFGSIISMAKRFFYGTPIVSTNTTASIVIAGMTASTSKLKEKRTKAAELLRRNHVLDIINKLVRRKRGSS